MKPVSLRRDPAAGLDDAVDDERGDEQHEPAEEILRALHDQRRGF